MIMFAKKTVLVSVMGSIFMFLFSLSALADIYRYVDKNGVMHFTNIKTDNRYRLYLRTAGRTPMQYINDFAEIISQASDLFDVAPSLIKAVIKAESDFDHEAVSSKGAQGLMQLMPKTADSMDVKDAFDPEENIFGGTRYLSLMLKRFNNDIKLAVAAYNAGPTAVEIHKGVPPILETQTFVKRVLAYYESFNAR